MEKYDISILKIKSKISLQSPGNVGATKGNCTNYINTKGNEEKKQQPIPSAPMIEEGKNQDLYEYIPYNISIVPNNEKGQDALQTVKVLNWRLTGFYELIAQIENGIYMLEYDKVPPANTNKFSEKSIRRLHYWCVNCC